MYNLLLPRSILKEISNKYFQIILFIDIFNGPKLSIREVKKSKMKSEMLEARVKSV